MTGICRRSVIHGGAAIFAAGATGFSLARAKPGAADEPVGALARRLLVGRESQIPNRDVVGVVDYAAPSWRPRFHLIDMMNGRVSSFLVAHGRGSDPGHTGWLRQFSNEVGSNATSFGAYRTGEIYFGRHGRAMRLIGLDAENSNAETRAIVIHAAWYVSQTMLDKFGKLGRSEGCFALTETALGDVLERLGPQRLLFAGKF
ncbi:MAG: murein L,D-transpeptidase catalytic domain family protein [Amphiplicatus sp.]